MVGKEAYIGFGSNVGDRAAYCRSALRLLEEVPGCTILRRSDLFRTEPVGVHNQDWYVNGVCRIRTRLAPSDLLSVLLGVETRMGRVRRRRWESRIIDLDLLLYGDEVIRESGLCVPHPLMHERRFVLVPMVQLAPDVIHPALGRTMRELLEIAPVKGQEVVCMKGDEM
jgi:2-amino-4-hydroxy-6-hydroxymethyldihydropteridine diphosphokinase